jgi:arsenical pump membrane protein
LPYLLTCALIANAASFLLPISNPANLVVFHNAMPPLTRWLAMFLVPSIVSIAITYLLLRWYSRRDLSQPSRSLDGDGHLTATGKITLFGILSVAVVLLVASARRQDLGLPTFGAGLVVATIVLICERSNPLRLVRDISWSILPLVAALFIIVEAVKTAGALSVLHDSFATALRWPMAVSSLAIGGAVAVGTDLVNNLPLGLISGAALQATPSHSVLSTAVLIGIDLGPNLSITGSLATLLWLIAIRREGLSVSGWQFLKVGMLVMPLSLLMAIGSAILLNSH